MAEAEESAAFWVRVAFTGRVTSSHSALSLLIIARHHLESPWTLRAAKPTPTRAVQDGGSSGSNGSASYSSHRCTFLHVQWYICCHLAVPAVSAADAIHSRFAARHIRRCSMTLPSSSLVNPLEIRACLIGCDHSSMSHQHRSQINDHMVQRAKPRVPLASSNHVGMYEGARSPPA